MPGKITRPNRTPFSHAPGQIRGTSYLQDFHRQIFWRETGEIGRRCTANFPMHGEVRSHNRQPTGHRFHQRMSKRLCIGGCDIDVTGTVYVVQQMVWHGSKFDDIIGDAEFADETRGRRGSIGARIRPSTQLAGQKKLDLRGFKVSFQNWKCPEESLEIAVVVVVTILRPQDSCYRVPASHPESTLH